MSGDVVPFTPAKAGEVAEHVLIRGNLAELTHAERARYYTMICESLGLNPLTKPFEYIELNRKLTLYALKACTDQLRKIHGVSVTQVTEEDRDGVHIVTAYVVDRAGRTDIGKGAVNIQGLRGDALANALMKAETKAKRRATLSLCGLGFLDETEIETIPTTAKSAPTESEVMQPGPGESREPRKNEANRRETDMRPPRARGAVLPARIQRNLDRLKPKPEPAPAKPGGLAERAILQRNEEALRSVGGPSKPFLASEAGKLRYHEGNPPPHDDIPEHARW